MSSLVNSLKMVDKYSLCFSLGAFFKVLREDEVHLVLFKEAKFLVIFKTLFLGRTKVTYFYCFD